MVMRWDAPSASLSIEAARSSLPMMSAILFGALLGRRSGNRKLQLNKRSDGALHLTAIRLQLQLPTRGLWRYPHLLEETVSARRSLGPRLHPRHHQSIDGPSHPDIQKPTGFFDLELRQ